uniref:Macro domain-containing protein n=1 Tax=Magnetococcus massalia (strain MO-1) TaxID=451514 RepID=A0A1S7LQS8_MAGMO|nr:Conserved protein of unknown function. Appr-1-p processing domain protein, UPF0189 protein SCO6450 [Candidatus Magnetococcus massalia]
MAQLEVLQGDITTLPADVVVNAANSTLLGGSGVDGAIHRAGGPAILEACKKLRLTTLPDGLPTGEAVATTAGKMLAEWVIHTVGPVYDRDPDPAENLKACYSNAMALAEELGAQSIAFPAISTGVYGYPKHEAAKIAVATLLEQAPNCRSLQRILLVTFSTEDTEILQQALGEGETLSLFNHSIGRACRSDC